MTETDELLDAAPPEGQPRETHLSEYWAIIVKHRRLIAIAVIASLAVAAALSLFTPSTYRATAVLNVERDQMQAFDLQSGAAQGRYYDPEFLPTQSRLMRSREVAERVVERLKLLQNPEFTTQQSGMTRGADAASKAASERRLLGAARAVQGGVSVTPIRGTNLVELSYVSSSPKLAADVANAIAEAYIDWHLESKYLIVGQASRFLTTQIEQLRSEISEKERQLQAYSAKTDIISVDPTQNITLQKLESLNRDYAAAVGDRVAKEARYYEIHNARPDAIADTLSNGLISQLRNEQAKLEREYAEKLNLFKPEWPAMQQLKAQIDKGRQHLNEVIQETVDKARENARSEYLTAQRREGSLKAVLQGQKSEAMVLNTNAVEYNNLKTEVDTKRALLDSMLKRQAETEITSRLRGERVSGIRIVDRALPPGARFRPSHKRNVGMGLIVGLMIGVGVAFLIEYMDRSLTRVDQVEQALHLPALGIIPAVGAASRTLYGYGSKKRRADDPDANIAIELLPHVRPHAAATEAYRAVRASLLLSRAGGIKSLTVTSSLAGEGKTSTVINLAVVLAQLGKRVLLVDGDLHKPRVHEVFRMSNRTGLVSILAEGVPPSDVIVKTKVNNLFVVPAGPISPNPSGLLSSDAMAKLLDFFGANFDYVLFDSPPVSLVADAQVLGNLTDGVVLCARGGRTPREIVARTRDLLIHSNVRILGVVINRLEEHGGAYGYYYGERYGYGERERELRSVAGGAK
ncbi:MAG: GumC family protein [Thermoanaerobaculia bacterium]